MTPYETAVILLLRAIFSLLYIGVGSSLASSNWLYREDKLTAMSNLDKNLSKQLEDLNV